MIGKNLPALRTVTCMKNCSCRTTREHAIIVI